MNTSRVSIATLLLNPSRAILRGVKTKSYPVIHQAQRPAYPAEVDYSSLNLTYPIQNKVKPIISEYGWTKPPDSLPNLPFIVERTKAHGLPIYTDYKHGRTKVVTILRKCKGNIDELKKDMEKVCQKQVEVRPGKLIVDGNYHLRLKQWLSDLGF